MVDDYSIALENLEPEEGLQLMAEPSGLCTSGLAGCDVIHQSTMQARTR